MIFCLPQTQGFPQTSLQMAIESLNTHANSAEFVSSWLRNALLQAKSLQISTTVDMAWTSTALAMTAFCVGFSQHENAVHQIARAQVFEDPSTMDEESLNYCIEICIFWVNHVAKSPLVSASDQVKVCSILVSSLRATQCCVSLDQDKREKLGDEILSVQVIAAISMATGYLAAPNIMFLSEARGIPESLASLVMTLMGGRTAARLFNLSSKYPWIPQRTGRELNKLISYVTIGASAGDSVTDLDTASAYYNAPSNLSCLPALARRQRYRSSSSSSSALDEERGQEVMKKIVEKRKKRRERSRSPERARVVARMSPASPVRRPRPTPRPSNGKCPRKGNMPCRGRWYSNRLKKIEVCIFGCEPPSTRK